jgi:protein-S-isoprenylcysteine O-methyltransferase Ste14
VVAQFAVMALIARGWTIGPHVSALQVPATIVALAGLAVALWAYRAMGRSFTAFPRPIEGGSLVESGPFRYVRHPVYAGGLVFFAGLSLALGPWGLAGTAVLAPLWWFKARYEERLLRERYPGYEAYAQRVRGRLVPRPPFSQAGEG